MALPKIKHPVFKLKLPSTEEMVRYRPYTVKEEKILLMINSSVDDIDFVSDNIKTIIRNCILEEELDVDKLTVFDVQYIFAKLRSKSVSETLQITIEEDNVEYRGGLNLEKLQVKRNKDHSNKIEINEEYGIVMRYPSFNDVIELEKKSDEDSIINLIVKCIDKIYDADKVYTKDDYTNDELKTWLDELPSGSFEKFEKFFDTAPHIKEVIKLKSKDGGEKEYVVDSLSDFFI